MEQAGALHVDIFMKQFVSKRIYLIISFIYLGFRAAAGMSCEAEV